MGVTQEANGSRYLASRVGMPQKDVIRAFEHTVQLRWSAGGSTDRQVGPEAAGSPAGGLRLEQTALWRAEHMGLTLP